VRNVRVQNSPGCRFEPALILHWRVVAAGTDAREASEHIRNMDRSDQFPILVASLGMMMMPHHLDQEIGKLMLGKVDCAQFGMVDPEDALFTGEEVFQVTTPVNTSGGLKSKGHPVGATGVAQLCDLVLQLRGEAGERQVKRAELGLAQNLGGSGATCVVTILGRA